jgi:glutamine amidotransferase-like uncharacterized protein
MDRLGVKNLQKNSMLAIKTMNEILHKNIEVRWLTQPGELITKNFPEGHFFQQGAFSIDYSPDITAQLREKNICFDIIESGIGEVIKPIKIALYHGKGTAEFCIEPIIEVLDLSSFNYRLLSDNDIKRGLLDSFDILLVPGGPDAGESYYWGLGKKGYKNIQSYVYNKGHYFGLCAGAYLALKPLSSENKYWLELVDATDDCELDYWRSGTGFVRINILDRYTPIIAGLAVGNVNTMDMIYWEGPAMRVLNNTVKIVAEYSDFIASGCQDHYPNWDLLDNYLAVKSIKEWYNKLTETRFNKYLENKAAILETTINQNRVVLISPHAEFGNIGISPKRETQSFQLITNTLFYLSIT